MFHEFLILLDWCPVWAFFVAGVAGIWLCRWLERKGLA
jgi:hypothetical protein